MAVTTAKAGLDSRRRWSPAWPWLLLLFAAPVLIVALTQDIGAHAFDAASEHIYRGVAFSHVIDDGVFFPRWTQSLHWGLGSPLFTFQPPLPYYGMDLLYRLGLPHPVGWRVLIAAGFALAFLGAFLLVYEITGRRWPALIAAVAYTYAPYVLWNSLERGSNEAYSMFLYPLVLWSLLWLAKAPSAGRFVVASAAWAACIASHVLGPLILAPFAGLLALVLAWRYRTTTPLLALLAGGLLTAFIWLPMGLEQQWVHVERDFTQPGAIPLTGPLSLKDLLSLPVLYDTVRDNNKGGLRTGSLPTAFLLVAVPSAIYAWRRNRTVAVALLAASAAGLLLLYMLVNGSEWIWQAGGPVLARLLYRMRLMGLQALAAACAAGLVVAILPQRWQKILAPLVAMVFLLIALPSLYVQYHRTYADFQQLPGLTGVRAMEVRHGGSALTAFGEFTPKWRSAPFDDQLLAHLGPDFDAQDRPLANEPDQVRVEASQVRNQAWDLELNTTEAVTATLNLLYYPRWQATLDGQPVPLGHQPETGYTQLALPAGEHRLALRYGRTGAETVGLALSALTLIVLVAASLWAAFRGRKVSSSSGVKPSAGQERVESSPPVWLLLGLTGLLALKVGVVDPRTTLFRCVSTAERVCGAEETVNVPFVDAPALRGYSISSYAVAPGDEVELKLFWQTGAPIQRSLASFVHVRPSSEKQPGNPHDESGMWVQAGQRSWEGIFSHEFVPRRIYEETNRLSLPADMPPGEYLLEVGWFDTATGEQADVPPEAVKPPLRILWRSVLLPNLHVGEQ